MSFTQQFDRLALQDILMADVFYPNGFITIAQFSKSITENILPIWGGCEVCATTIKPSQVHALCLKLVAAKFIEVTVPNKKFLGSKKLNKSEMYVSLVRDPLTRPFHISNTANWSLHNFNSRDGPV